LVASFCPNCEQPVAADDRHCDVCNAPLDPYRANEPGPVFTGTNPDLQRQIDAEMERLRATRSTAEPTSAGSRQDETPSEVFIPPPPPPNGDTHDSGRVKNADRDTQQSLILNEDTHDPGEVQFANRDTQHSEPGSDPHRDTQHSGRVNEVNGDTHDPDASDADWDTQHSEPGSDPHRDTQHSGRVNEVNGDTHDPDASNADWDTQHSENPNGDTHISKISNSSDANRDTLGSGSVNEVNGDTQQSESAPSRDTYHSRREIEDSHHSLAAGLVDSAVADATGAIPDSTNTAANNSRLPESERDRDAGNSESQAIAKDAQPGEGTNGPSLIDPPHDSPNRNDGPQPTIVLEPAKDLAALPNYEPESSLPPLPPPEPEPAPRSTEDMRRQSAEFASAPMATPDDVQQQIDSEIIETCQRLHRQGYEMYGLFGRPSTGKSSMIYALRHHFTKGDPGFGGYATEGENWDQLAEDLEAQWQSRQVPTSDRLHPYLALHPRGGGKHIALLDIAGERFEGIQSWTDEIFEFFGLYLAYCQGFFILIELDDLAAADQVGYDARARMQSQMARVVRFLAVAGQMEKLKSTADVKAKRAAAEAAVSGTGKVKVRVPVSLCLSKADLVGQMKFGPRLGKVIPGSHSPQSDPWNVLQAIWPEHTRTLLEMVPFLKVDWLSCLGTHFESERQFTGSIGLRSAFQHVVTDPPPRWSLSTASYLKWQKWLRL